MKITLYNYEVWLLDFIEGRLNEEQTALLMLFLADHPEIEAETEPLPTISMQGGAGAFGWANQLKKPSDAIAATAHFNANNYETSFAAYYEGDLDNALSEELHHFVSQNPHLKAQFTLFGNLIVEPDPAVVFENKSTLKHSRRIPLYVRWSIPAAAAVALFAVFNFATLFRSDHQSASIPMAQTTSEPSVLSPSKPNEMPSGASRANADSDSNAGQDVGASLTGAQSEAINNQKPSQSAPRAEYYLTVLEPIKPKPLQLVEPSQVKMIEEARYYTCLYADIRLRDQIKFQEEIAAQGSQTIYGDAKAAAGRNRFDLWTIARLSVRGFNFITNSDVEFAKARDEEGNVTDFAIGGDAIRIAHSSK